VPAGLIVLPRHCAGLSISPKHTIDGSSGGRSLLALRAPPRHARSAAASVADRRIILAATWQVSARKSATGMRERARACDPVPATECGGFGRGGRSDFLSSGLARIHREPFAPMTLRAIARGTRTRKKEKPRRRNSGGAAASTRRGDSWRGSGLANESVRWRTHADGAHGGRSLSDTERDPDSRQSGPEVLQPAATASTR
jgi:hypothetical protein